MLLSTIERKIKKPLDTASCENGFLLQLLICPWGVEEQRVLSEMQLILTANGLYC